MDKYIVTIGGDKKEVLATDHDSALRQVLQSCEKLRLSKMTGVLKEGEDAYDCELLYSIDLLRNNGYLDGMKITYLN